MTYYKGDNKMETNTTTKANSPKDYKCIARWGHHLRSYDYYIQQEQAKAFADNAPITAIYYNDNEGWHIAETISNKELRDFIINEDK
tara:strand:- start:327 stop:587 length:261 start_codon:yes stop_codon:yes gene_type:complete